MNYITACPKCDTQFLLNDELIKAYQGNVQCGHCEHVFNATDRLTEVTDDITSADEYQASLEEAAKETTKVSAEKNTVTIDKAPEAAPEVTDASNQHTDVDYYISALTPPTEAEPEPEPEVVEPQVTEPEPIKTQTTSEDATSDIDHLFNKKHQKNKVANKSSFFTKFVSFLLFLALIFQCAYFLRHHIARQFPPIKLLLERACVPLKCTIDLSQNLDLITIGDSDMQEDDTYQSVIKFTSSLKNNATYPQAYPSIELTLTDTDDLPVIKKLITPEVYLAASEKVTQGLSAHETANVKLSFHVNDPSVASYRIQLLY